jgi:acetyl-CoA carboxylase biotin carboxyl carrier protein
VAPRKKKAGTKRAVRKKAPATRGRAKTARRTRRATKAPSESTFPEVEELVELMNRHGLHEVDYESGTDGTRRIRVSRGGATVGHAPVAAAPIESAPAPSAADASAATGKAEGAAPADSSEGLHAFKSPMVGTFYRAPSPESPPFASVGDPVDATTTVCIIEAMKVMNEIVPDVGGEVVSVEVENGEAVEYGQTLFLIRTA